MVLSPEELTARLAAKFLQNGEFSITPILGLGKVNIVRLIETKTDKYVVRLNLEETASRFRKENWCIHKAAALGIPSPQLIEYGEFSGATYMIQAFIEGSNGKSVGGDKTPIWTKLGQYARLYHTVSVIGFGEDLIDEQGGVFQDTWQRFVRYNVDSLNVKDPLRAMGVLTAKTSVQLRIQFAQLLQTPFRFGLTHGDVADWNTVVNPQGKIFLLDWGCAEAHIVPHHELTNMMQSGFVQESAEFQAFLDGYGLTKADFQAMQPDLHLLSALQAIDKLRWAIDRNPIKIAEFAQRAKQAVASLS